LEIEACLTSQRLARASLRVGVSTQLAQSADYHIVPLQPAMFCSSLRPLLLLLLLRWSRSMMTN